MKEKMVGGEHRLQITERWRKQFFATIVVALFIVGVFIPTINADASGPNISSWFIQPKYGKWSYKYITSHSTICLHAEDEDGIKFIKYRLDGGDWIKVIPTGCPKKFTYRFTVDIEGEHTIKFFAKDCEGYRSGKMTRTFYVDDTPPTTIVNQIDDTKKIIFIADDGAGVGHCTICYATMKDDDIFSKDETNIEWHKSNSPLILDFQEAKKVVAYYSMDILGNEEPINKINEIA